MPSWSGCRIEIVPCGGGPTFADDGCEVRIESGGVALHYWDDEGPVVFVGEERGRDHFHLVCRSRPRTATLHRFAGEPVLEGSWSEGSARGFWRVLLPPDGAAQRGEPWPASR